MKKWFWMFGSLFLFFLLTLWACTPQSVVSSVEPTPPTTAATIVKFNYFRFDGKYGDWDIWVWTESPEPVIIKGVAVPFDEIVDGWARATFEYPEKLSRIGFIVRRGGNGWKEKDVGKNRYITVGPDGKAEVWLIQGVETIYLQKPNFESFVRDDPTSTTVVVHYKRHDGDYYGWNLWVWTELPDPVIEEKVVYFQERDDYGAKATITFPFRLSRLGFKVRRRVNGNEWGQVDVDMDRFITIGPTEVTEVWLIQGDPTVYYQRP